MENIEIKSLEEILKESFNKCKSVDEKINKLIGLIATHARLMDHIISSLPNDSQMEIFNKA